MANVDLYHSKIPMIVLKKKVKHLQQNDRYLYEIISSDKPCRPYLDIEWKPEDYDKELGKQKTLLKI